MDDDDERGLSFSFLFFPTEPHEECLRGIEEEGVGGEVDMIALYESCV